MGLPLTTLPTTFLAERGKTHGHIEDNAYFTEELGKIAQPSPKTRKIYSGGNVIHSSALPLDGAGIRSAASFWQLARARPLARYRRVRSPWSPSDWKRENCNDPRRSRFYIVGGFLHLHRLLASAMARAPATLTHAM